MNNAVVENVKSYAISKNECKHNYYFIIKRGFDLLASSIGLVLLAPLFLLIAIMIKIDSKGNVFYKHKRIGKNGKYIYLYKFRTMYSNANELFNNFTDEQKKEFEINYKLEKDPRITKIGNILRKTSLDELPQLINILIGDMALVGPRPVVDGEIDKFGLYKNQFLSVKPGLTGNWAANGRSNTTYDERINMELYYVKHCNMKLDTKIIFKTIKSVFLCRGAK